MTEQEARESIEKTQQVEAQLQALLQGLPPVVQLDALLRVYVKLGVQHGELDKVGHSLIELGGSIVFRQMLSERVARTTSPAPGQPDQHAAPTTLQ